MDENASEAVVQAYATSVFEGAVIELKGNKRSYLIETVTLSPTTTFKSVVTLDEGDQPHNLKVTVRDAQGRLLIGYQPKQPEIEQVPDAAKPLDAPEKLKTNEQLYLAGLHLEQYRHATFEPESYYLEGLKRDPDDIRINVAYGTLLLRRGLFTESEKHFRRAISSLTWRNPNPYDSEAYYQLGLSLKLQGRLEEAFTALYKSVWSAAWQDSGYFTLAQIAGIKGSYAEALELVERSLIRNSRNYKARHLKGALLRKLGRAAEALAWAEETLRLDVADFGAGYEQAQALEQLGRQAEAAEASEKLVQLMRNDAHNYMSLASDYAGCGLNEEAKAVIGILTEGESSGAAYPMLHYTLAYIYEQEGNTAAAAASRKNGREAAPDYCFPNSLFDLIVLHAAIASEPEDYRARYYLGNLLYDKKRAGEAVAQWETSRSLKDDFATVHRNLALAYFNKQGNPEAALQSLEKAFACEPQDARVFFELDQLYKKIGRPAAERLETLTKHKALVEQRDDLYVEYVTLLNATGQHEQAIQALSARNFHPWEGGEGKVTGQYVLAHVELGKRSLQAGNHAEAIQSLEKSLVYPQHLGEGKLDGAQENNIYYFLGNALEGLGQQEAADECYHVASQGLDEPASAMYYNDQPPDMIFYQGLSWLKLGNEKEAKRRFNKLIDYAEKHLFDDVKIDYFAVSLPDFLVFEEDLNRRNIIHCRYMRGLGLLGLSRSQEAAAELQGVLELEPNHLGAKLHLQMA